MFMASYIDNTYQLYLNVNGGMCSIGDNCYSESFDLGGRPINPNADAEYVTALINGLPEKLSRDGYVLRGLFLDKMGKRPIPTDYRFLSEKVGDEVTIYAVWDKK